MTRESFRKRKVFSFSMCMKHFKLLYLMSFLLSFAISGVMAQDPGLKDTVRIECVEKVRPNETVELKIYAWTDEVLAGFIIHLTFYHPNNIDIYCDSIIWGTWVASQSPHIVVTSWYNGSQGDSAKTLRIGAVWFYGGLSPGNGLLTTVYFHSGPSWDSTIFVNVDTTFLSPPYLWKLEFVDTNAVSFQPQFLEGCLGGTRPPDFLLTTEPYNQAVLPGDTVSYLVTLTSRFGFNSPCTLEVSGLCGGVEGWFSSDIITPPDSTILWIAVSDTVSRVVTCPLSITGRSNEVLRTAQALLTVIGGVGGVPIAYGARVQDSIDFVGGADAYNFVGDSGDVVIIRMNRTSGGLNPYLALFGPDGSRTVEAGPIPYDYERAEIVDQVLSDSGTYILLVSDDNSVETGGYWLSLQCRQFLIANADTLKPPADTLVDTLENYGNIKAYIFLVDQNDSTEFRLKRKSSNIDPSLELYGPEDSLIARAHDSYEAVLGDINFSKSGKYVIFVSDYEGDEFGGYELSWKGVLGSAIFEVSSIQAPDSITPLGVGIAPKAIVTNIGWKEETYYARFRIGHVYSESTQVLSLHPWESDTLTFPVWIPNEAAAYLTICSTHPEGALISRADEKIGMVSVSSGVGPEIHTISPTVGVSGQPVTVSITGARFENGITARLTLSGEDDIVANGSSINFVNESLIKATFDLTDAVADQWDLHVINPDSRSYCFYDAFKIIPFEGQILPFGSWQEFLVHDGSSINVGVDVPNVTDLFVLLKKTTHIGYSGTWSGSLRLLKQGEQIAYRSGSSDFDIHIQIPEPGWYTLEIFSDDPGEGLIKVCSAIDTLNLGEWKIGEVLRPYGCDWVQLDVPSGQASLFLQTEGFGLWSTLDVYYGSLSNPIQHWQFSNMGAGYHIEGEIPNPPAGRYYLKYMDSAVMEGGDQTRQYMIMADTDPIYTPPPVKPTITALSTHIGGTAGPVTVIISGSGLDSAAVVSLVRDGYDDIPAYDILGDSTGLQLVVAFNLGLAQPGEWALVVTNPGGQSDTADSPFVIQSGGEPTLWIEITGRDQIRVGRWSTYIISYGNAGITDANHPIFWIRVPQNYQYQIELPLIYPVSDTAKPRTILVMPGKVCVGATKEFILRLLTFDTMSATLEAGFLTSPPELPELRKTKEPLSNFDSLYLSGLIRASKPLPGEMVFHKFRLLPGSPPTNWPAHNGIYYEDANGIGWVVDFLIDGKVHCLLYETWKTVNGPNTYIGHSHPPGWNTDKGQAIAAEAYAKFLAGEQGKYWGIPIFSDQDNCLSWARKIYAKYNCELLGDKFTSPIELYELWEWVLLEFGDEQCWFTCDEEDMDIWEEMESMLTDEAPVFISKNVIGVGSMTPEDKYGPNGFDEASTPADLLVRFIQWDKQLNYRVDFWNKEDATAPAQIVFVEDTLDTDFDLATFGFTTVGFLRWNVPLGGGQYFNVNVDTRPDMNLIVNVEGTFDPDHRVVKWVFRSLDPVTGQPPQDPMAGFLPPIDSTGYQIGWVDFTIKPKTGLPTGTQITNQAFVNFDSVGGFNPAPKEKPYLNTIDALAPTSRISALPDTIYDHDFQVCWSGKDDSLGSGIRSYAIYYSVNGGPDSVWLANTTDTCATFYASSQPAPSRSYSFYCIARDNVGNIETKPLVTDTSRIVSAVVSVEEEKEEKLPFAFSLSQNYPNPFNPNTVIQYALPHNCQVEIVIYNILGQKVRTLINEKQTAGYRRAIWDSNNDKGEEVSSGIYFYKIKAGDFTKSKKMVILK